METLPAIRVQDLTMAYGSFVLQRDLSFTVARGDIFVIMGGFHLTGPDAVEAIEPTVAALQAFAPCYIVLTHCTGRKAIVRIEQAMPAQFLLNMSGTNMVFAGSGG